ncbi:MAG TPA: hypothetical protein VIJ57_14420 [Hanamia sp.]
MGLIREPKNIDFTVLDKPWTDEERKEFSAFIKLRKEQRKKRQPKKLSSTRKKIDVSESETKRM